VKFRLRDKSSDFKWVLVAVYGAAQPEFKESFLTELVQSCYNENLPLCIGGISILFGTIVKTTMTNLKKGGLSFLTLSWRAWICEKLNCLGVSIHGLTLVGYLHMIYWTECWLVLNGSKISHWRRWRHLVGRFQIIPLFCLAVGEDQGQGSATI
jgi:hypothetical protein